MIVEHIMVIIIHVSKHPKKSLMYAPYTMEQELTNSCTFRIYSTAPHDGFKN